MIECELGRRHRTYYQIPQDLSCLGARFPCDSNVIKSLAPMCDQLPVVPISNHPPLLVSSWFYRPAAARLARRPWSQIRFLFPMPHPIITCVECQNSIPTALERTRYRPFSLLLPGVSNACKPKRRCSYAHARCSITLGKGSRDIVVITVAVTVAVRIIIDRHGICLGAH